MYLSPKVNLCPPSTRKYATKLHGDGGRPLGAGLQEQASNHLKLLWSNVRVVSVKEKAPCKVRWNRMAFVLTPKPLQTRGNRSSEVH